MSDHTLNIQRQISSQVIPLPEDILKKKWAGDFSGAIDAIDARLKLDLPDMLRDRITIERQIISRLSVQYPFTREQALSEVTAHIPGFTQSEFDQLESEGGIDFLFVQGEKRYFKHIYAMLSTWDSAYITRSGGTPSTSRPILDDAIAQMKRDGHLGYRIRIKISLLVEDSAFVPGETYRVHLPIPKPCAQQSNIEIIAQDGALIAPEDAPQRTVFYERQMNINEPFEVEYAYDSRVRYIDLLAKPSMNSPLYEGERAPCDDDLGECWPHLAFTPYIRALAKDIRGDETDPIVIARRAYEFVTTKVRYSFLRDYFLVDNVSEYVALNLKGDCGAQTLLFMALCRLNGIPTRWQSGTNARVDSMGSHDWCQYYVEPYGWLLCDVSFGGGAWHAGNHERWNFYFGNLDPFRMVANDAYMGGFTPEKYWLRNDPYDNQSGECEITGRGLEFNEHHTERTLIDLSPL